MLPGRSSRFWRGNPATLRRSPDVETLRTDAGIRSICNRYLGDRSLGSLWDDRGCARTGLDIYGRRSKQRNIIGYRQELTRILAGGCTPGTTTTESTPEPGTLRADMARPAKGTRS